MSFIKDLVPSSFYYLFGFEKITKASQWIKVLSAHAIAWLLFFSLPLFFFPIQISNDANFLYKELINKVFLIVFFYFNYFVLIPKFFFRRKRGAYALLLLLSFIILVSQHLMIENYFMGRFGSNPQKTFMMRMDTQPANRIMNEPFELGGGMELKKDSVGFNKLPMPMEEGFRTSGNERIFFRRPGVFFIELANTFSSAVFLILLGSFIHLAFIFLKNQDEKKTLENVNLKAELNLLKSQINPHFLFNAFNSIYSQVYHKSPNAERSVLKLSEILRYVIYDTAAEMTPLEKDLHYLSNYIDLQKMRLSDKVKINYTVKGDPKNFSIAPLLLITFIENAFKHGISYSKPSVINISVEIFNKTLTMVVSNPVVTDATFESPGIGLKNVKRRLDLLYKENYWLDVVLNENLYIINLKINLQHD